MLLKYLPEGLGNYRGILDTIIDSVCMMRQRIPCKSPQMDVWFKLFYLFRTSDLVYDFDQCNTDLKEPNLNACVNNVVLQSVYNGCRDKF